MVSLFRRGSVWWVTYQAGGRQFRRSLHTSNKRVASDLKAQVERRLLLGEPVAPERVPLARYVEEYRAYSTARKRPKTHATDMGRLGEFLATVKAAWIDDLTTADVSRFLDLKVNRDGIGPATVLRYREILHAFFQHARRLGYLRENPVSPIPRPRLPERDPEFLRQHQIDQVLKAVEGDTIHPLAATLIYAGLRREEACWLTRDDLDLSSRPPILRVRAKTVDGESWMPKTKRDRVVPVSPKLLEILRGTKPGKGPWLFPSREGRRWNPDNLSRRWRALMRAADLEVNFLTLRHTFGSQLALKGVSLLKIAKLMGNSPATGEQLEDEVEYQPGFIKRVVHHRTVYGLSDEDARERQAPEIVAASPVRPIEGSVVGAVLLGWILVQEYAHHLPLYRQEAMLERDGLRVPRQTMCDWMLAAAEVLGPIQQALRREILATGVVQIDDTPVRCQGPKGHGNFQAHLWTVTSPEVEGVVYEFTEGRGHEYILEVLPDYKKGWLVGDGYSGYDAVVSLRPEFVTTGCWAHVIRKFKDALNEAPLLAVEAVTTIAKLFDLEESARELPPDERLDLRKRKAPKIIEDLDSLLDGWKDSYPESGSLGTACKYVENQRVPLLRFLEDGRLPIHNNACEVSIRPVAIGRKNWLFAGSLRGGRAAATIYTLVECCKLAGVDPHAYLADVLVHVATHPASRVEELLPARWKAWVGTSAPAAAESTDQAPINA